MVWKLNKVKSSCGEEPGSTSVIGFRGTRFSITHDNKLSITDYNREITYADNENTSQFCKDVKGVMGSAWKGSEFEFVQMETCMQVVIPQNMLENLFQVDKKFSRGTCH